jgi:hypothetical protein
VLNQLVDDLYNKLPTDPTLLGNGDLLGCTKASFLKATPVGVCDLYLLLKPVGCTLHKNATIAIAARSLAGQKIHSSFRGWAKKLETVRQRRIKARASPPDLVPVINQSAKNDP